MIITTKKIKDIIFTLLLFVLAIANASPHIFLYGYQRPLYFAMLLICIVITLFRVVNGAMISKDYLVRIVLVALKGKGDSASDAIKYMTLISAIGVFAALIGTFFLKKSLLKLGKETDEINRLLN